MPLGMLCEEKEAWQEGTGDDPLNMPLNPSFLAGGDSGVVNSGQFW